MLSNKISRRAMKIHELILQLSQDVESLMLVLLSAVQERGGKKKRVIYQNLGVKESRGSQATIFVLYSHVSVSFTFNAVLPAMVLAFNFIYRIDFGASFLIMMFFCYMSVTEEGCIRMTVPKVK